VADVERALATAAVSLVPTTARAESFDPSFFYALPAIIVVQQNQWP
jgi:hypothetical protein